MKNRSRKSISCGGYTITEVLIFLAVTAGMFVMIAGTFNGRQRRAEFSTGTREMEARIQDIANDIATGYYSNSGTFTCSVNSSGLPIISPGVGQQGKNQDCILVGRVAHMDVNGTSGERYAIYSVAGARQYNHPFNGKNDVEDFDQARPQAITAPGMIEEQQMPVGLRVRSMYVDGGARIRGIGFYTTFNAGSSDPTSLSVNLVPLDGHDQGAMVGRINNLASYAAANLNPARGVVVCMEDDTASQHALLRIGRSSSRLTTDTEIGGGSCAARGYAP